MKPIYCRPCIRVPCHSAREYRDSNTTEEQYSPTSTFAAVRVLLVLSMIFDLCISSMDIKDAFLLVEQQEEMLVVLPEWVKQVEGGSASHWRLRRRAFPANATQPSDGTSTFQIYAFRRECSHTQWLCYNHRGPFSNKLDFRIPELHPWLAPEIPNGDNT